MTDRRLQIAFVTCEDPRSKRSWSGTVFFMAKALQKHCGDVCYLGPAPGKQFGGKVYNRVVQSLFGKRFDYSHSASYARRCARFFEKKLSERAFDVIFAPAASTGIAELQTTIPIVYASDVTFSLIRDYYPEFSNLLARSVREGDHIEKAAITRSRIALYSSAWAADSAISDYGADSANVRVIPFGANMDTIPHKETVLRSVRGGRCRLLFPAVNWSRKGGDIAFETLVILTKLGIDAELVVCGCTPPTNRNHARMKVIPFLNKDNPQQMSKLVELYQTSDFLLLPTRYDCTPIVICEANAFGLPVLTTDTGGVPSLIKNNENGFLHPFSAGGEQYARTIAEVYRDKSRLHALRCSSRNTFDGRLNWDSWARTVQSIFDEILSLNEAGRESAPGVNRHA